MEEQSGNDDKKSNSYTVKQNQKKQSKPKKTAPKKSLPPLPPAKISKNNQYNCDGKDITQCVELKRIISALRFYKINHNSKDELLKYMTNYETQLISDYHHILQKHLNEDNLKTCACDKQFELMYTTMMDQNELFCDVNKCKVFQRNNRQRETQNIGSKFSDDKKAKVFIDILDSIHCYFIHSVDIGYRNIQKLMPTHVNVDTSNSNVYLDLEIIALKSHLDSTRNKLEAINAQKRSMNKFMTETITESTGDDEKNNEPQEYKQNVEEINNSTIPTDVQYSFGERFNYWSEGNYSSTKDKHQKYDSLKPEITHNNIYSIPMETFNEALNKAEHLIKNSSQIKSMKSDRVVEMNMSHGLPMDVSHIISVILYTDYDTLSYNFSKTFRKIRQNETEEEIKNRNGEYYNWSKLLAETVNGYGNLVRESSISVYYHGVSVVYFSRFVTTFNSPTSTTTKLAVATIFAKNDGIILELQQYSAYHSRLRYFNCTFVSCFQNEGERLFVLPPGNGVRIYYLQFASIRNMSTDENYKLFMNALRTLEGLFYDRKCLDKSLQTLRIISLLVKNQNTFSSYIQKTFRKWCYIPEKLDVDIGSFPNLLKHFFFCNNDSKTVNLLSFYNVTQIFKNVTEIRCQFIRNVNSFTGYFKLVLEDLSKLNQQKSKLHRIELCHMKCESQSLDLNQFAPMFKAKNWYIKKNYLYVLLEYNVKQK